MVDLPGGLADPDAVHAVRAASDRKAERPAAAVLEHPRLRRRCTFQPRGLAVHFHLHDARLDGYMVAYGPLSPPGAPLPLTAAPPTALPALRHGEKAGRPVPHAPSRRRVPSPARRPPAAPRAATTTASSSRIDISGGQPGMVLDEPDAQVAPAGKRHAASPAGGRARWWAPPRRSARRARAPCAAPPRRGRAPTRPACPAAGRIVGAADLEPGANAAVPSAPPAPDGTSSTSTRPVAGRKPWKGSSLVMRHSTAWPSRRTSSWPKERASPAATRNCHSTRSIPVTSSVTGCSTCSRVVHLQEVVLAVEVTGTPPCPTPT